MLKKCQNAEEAQKAIFSRQKHVQEDPSMYISNVSSIVHVICLTFCMINQNLIGISTANCLTIFPSVTPL